jgi:hypothetical protein
MSSDAKAPAKAAIVAPAPALITSSNQPDWNKPAPPPQAVAEGSTISGQSSSWNVRQWHWEEQDFSANTKKRLTEVNLLHSIIDP